MQTAASTGGYGNCGSIRSGRERVEQWYDNVTRIWQPTKVPAPYRSGAARGVNRTTALKKAPPQRLLDRRETYGDGFAPGVRSDMKLDTVLDRTGARSLS